MLLFCCKNFVETFNFVFVFFCIFNDVSFCLNNFCCFSLLVAKCLRHLFLRSHIIYNIMRGFPFLSFSLCCFLFFTFSIFYFRKVAKGEVSDENFLHNPIPFNAFIVKKFLTFSLFYVLCTLEQFFVAAVVCWHLTIFFAVIYLASV